MRLFIAALFPEDTIEDLKELRENLRRSSESGSFIPDSNLHLTLAFLGECNEKQEDDAVSAMNYREAEPSRYPTKAAPLVWGS